jgi:hypothetical protein
MKLFREESGSSIISNREAVYLYYPEIIDVPYAGLVNKTLNNALTKRFSISESNQNVNYLNFLEEEEGIEGRYKGNYINLISMAGDGFLGLYTKEPSRESDKIFEFYRIMLEHLFNTKNESCLLMAKNLDDCNNSLKQTLFYIKGKEFANQVMIK